MAQHGQQSRKRINHTWTAEEDKILVDCLLEIGLAWKGDHGFRAGFANHLEKMILKKIPRCTLKASPHITSRIKLLKKQYNAICTMMGPMGGSRFCWNDKEKIIKVEKEIYDEWVKTHPNAKGLYRKPFPYFDQLGVIFGKDAANGDNAKGPENAIGKMDKEADVFVESGTGANDVFDLTGDTPQTTNCDPMLDNATQEGVEHTPVSNSVVRRARKRDRSEEEALVEVVAAMKKLSQAYQNINDNIQRLVSCFDYQAEGSNRRMSLLEELRKIERLSVSQRVHVAMIMAKDGYIIDLFMQGDHEERDCLVALLLAKSL
ncbi:uncharacterized protein LOC133309654 [Gastrolobium bilobum]|uniref:uncharacterized protein LOC133309654 n=1 Tax=Gastrolobium bilobum TaxID=150636 RepID=UPI002AB231D3|nr:uncharacterized protein LOC133309654 [Gastrolobium bilobum]